MNLWSLHVWVNFSRRLSLNIEVGLLDRARVGVPGGRDVGGQRAECIGKGWAEVVTMHLVG